MISSRVWCSTGLFPATFETSFGGVLRVLSACNPGILGETLSCGTQKENFQTGSNELLISGFIVPVRSAAIALERCVNSKLILAELGGNGVTSPIGAGKVLTGSQTGPGS